MTKTTKRPRYFYKTNSGTYRVRMRINGKQVSKNLPTQKAAKLFIAELTANRLNS